MRAVSLQDVMRIQLDKLRAEVFAVSVSVSISVSVSLAVSVYVYNYVYVCSVRV